MFSLGISSRKMLRLVSNFLFLCEYRGVANAELWSGIVPRPSHVHSEETADEEQS